jgi:hypothetical protein
MCTEVLLKKEVVDTSKIVTSMLLYKIKQVRFCGCKNFLTYKFKKGNYKAGIRFELWWSYIAIAIYAVEVLFTYIDLFTTEQATESND